MKHHDLDEKWDQPNALPSWDEPAPVVQVPAPSELYWDNPKNYWGHILTQPIRFRLIKILGLCISLPAGIAAFALPIGLLLLLSHYDRGSFLSDVHGVPVLDSDGLATALDWLSRPIQGVKYLNEATLYLWFPAAMTVMGQLYLTGEEAYATRRQFLFEIFRLPVKDGIGVLIAIPVVVFLVRMDVMEPFLVSFIAIAVFYLARKTVSVIFHARFDRWLYAREAIAPTEDPLRADPDVLRSPPD